MKRLLFLSLLLTVTAAYGQQDASLHSASLISKNVIAGMSSDYIQFAIPANNGTLIVGANKITKLTSEDQVVLEIAPPGKGEFEIQCHVELADGGYVFGGWNKVAGKNNLWLFKLDASLNRVWEKNIPVKDGVILALTEDKVAHGLWAVTTEYISRKEFVQFIRFFDYAGNIKESWQLDIGNASTRLNQDVSIFQTVQGGFAIFGLTADNIFEGYQFLQKRGNLILLNRSVTIEEKIMDKTYANFITLQRSDGGFHATYEAASEPGASGDYRLVFIDESLKIVDSKYIGGSELDGPSSMVMDKAGNLILAGFSYSGVSDMKSEPAFEKDHCDAWVVKINPQGEKLWDKTIGGPGCIFQARVFISGKRIGVIFKEDTGTNLAWITED